MFKNKPLQDEPSTIHQATSFFLAHVTVYRRLYRSRMNIFSNTLDAVYDGMCRAMNRLIRFFVYVV